jgi:hypothetical protein
MELTNRKSFGVFRHVLISASQLAGLLIDARQSGIRDMFKVIGSRAPGIIIVFHDAGDAAITVSVED